MKKTQKCITCQNVFSSYNPNPIFCSLKCKGDYQSANIDFEKAKKLYETGMTQYEVAEKLGTTQKVIHSLFKRNNYQARVAAKRDQRGEKNTSWKGDNVTYAAFHYRVQSARGKANKCSLCGIENTRIEWANLTGKYSDVNDYQMMCVSCHHKHDGHENNLPNRKRPKNINKRNITDGK